jgi:c-di-GMP-binding flagellar brake protein YcgR
MPTAPLPTQGSERYLLRHAPEIERILRDIMDSKTHVAIYDTKGRDFILSSIVAMDAKEGFLLVEQGSSQVFNRRLADSDHVTCVTSHDQVHIQFTTKHILPTFMGEEAVFRLPIPKEMLRLQRREYYRLGTSVINPVRCAINTPHGLIDTVVVDISIGGMGILSYEGAGLLLPGNSYHGCRVTLPGIGEFAVSLTVRSTFDLTLKNGRVTHRAGCQFIDLHPSVETEIQRYINRVERERLARYI